MYLILLPCFSFDQYVIHMSMKKLNSTNALFLKFYKIVLEIRKHGLFFKLSGLDFRKLFLNTFYIGLVLHLIGRNVLNSKYCILDSRYHI